ncbi:MAG: hypothetical protein ABS917_05240 [Solibacillus sp.]|uniref:hypothetical protein n=1 Tax=Solibacillus sp. TaxID=1909654 RepID=UPI0033146012
MKPVLIVEGKQMEVITQHLINGQAYKVEVFENNPMESTFYYDVNYKDQFVEEQLRIDFSKYLINPKEQFDIIQIHQTIEGMIDVKANNLKDIAVAYMEAELNYPFKSAAIKLEYQLEQRVQIGLKDALEVVEVYMQDDVDLSGGEEIESN